MTIEAADRDCLTPVSLTLPGVRRENLQKSLKPFGLESWYRYGDSNPGPVAENHVS